MPEFKNPDPTGPRTFPDQQAYQRWKRQQTHRQANPYQETAALGSSKYVMGPGGARRFLANRNASFSSGGGAGPAGGGGGVPYMPPGGGREGNFQVESTPYMKEVMDMYRDLIQQNRDLAGQYNVDDILNRARAEGSIAMREAEAQAQRGGGMSSAERRNLMSDQYRTQAGLTGDTERQRLEFERGLLADLGGAISGAGGLAGTQGDFLNQAQRNQMDFSRAMMEYPLRVADMQNNAMNARISAMASLSGLI